MGRRTSPFGLSDNGECVKIIKVYSDGSSCGGKVGAAATLTRGGVPLRSHYHLGPDSEHTVHEAELIGILLALQLIKTERATNPHCSRCGQPGGTLSTIPPTCKPPTFCNPMTTLWCYIKGERDIFGATISPDRTIDGLKDTLKEKRSNRLSTVDAANLILTKVRYIMTSM